MAETFDSLQALVNARRGAVPQHLFARKIGVDPKTLYRLCRGENVPNEGTRMLLAAKLKVSRKVLDALLPAKS